MVRRGAAVSKYVSPTETLLQAILVCVCVLLIQVYLWNIHSDMILMGNTARIRIGLLRPLSGVVKQNPSII
jgi:hypothetical protein